MDGSKAGWIGWTGKTMRIWEDGWLRVGWFGWDPEGDAAGGGARDKLPRN